MKFTADRQALAEATTWVAQVLSKFGSNGASSGLRLTLEGAELSVCATDLNAVHRATLDVMPAEDGDILVPGFLFRDLVAAMRGNDVGVTVADDELTLTAGRSTYRSRLLRLEDFPDAFAIGEADEGALVGTMQAEDLKRALGAVVHLVDDEDLNESVRGVRLEGTDDGLTVVGAQTAAISVAQATFDTRGPLELGTQVPAGPLVKGARGLAGLVTVRFHDTLLELADETRSVAFRTYADSFVKWRKILREESPMQVTVSAADLLDAVRRAALASSEKDPGATAVDLTFDEEAIEVRSCGADVASGQEFVDAEGGGANQVRMGVRLLNGALATFREAVVIGMVPDTLRAPLILTSPDEAEQLNHVVMPRRPNQPTRSTS